MNATMSGNPLGGSRPAIPITVKIQVSLSLRNTAIPVGRPGTGPTTTAISFSIPGGSRSNWLEYTKRTSTCSSAGRP